MAPSAGSFSGWWNTNLIDRFIRGSATPASSQKMDGFRVSRGARLVVEVVAIPRLPFEDEVGPELAQLADEVLVAAGDDADVGDGRRAVGGEGRDQVAEAAAQVGNLDVGS